MRLLLYFGFMVLLLLSYEFFHPGAQPHEIIDSIIYLCLIQLKDLLILSHTIPAVGADLLFR